MTNYTLSVYNVQLIVGGGFLLQLGVMLVFIIFNCNHPICILSFDHQVEVCRGQVGVKDSDCRWQQSLAWSILWINKNATSKKKHCWMELPNLRWIFQIELYPLRWSYLLLDEAFSILLDRRHPIKWGLKGTPFLLIYNAIQLNWPNILIS